MRLRSLHAFVLTLALAACAPAPAVVESPAAGARGSGGLNRPEHRDTPYLVLVSLDGFMPSYVDRFALPNLRRIAARGVRAGAMIPVFPSLTFPNHYSLVTGLHPQAHGLVSNSFYDPARRQTYVYTQPASVTDGTWYGGEPIWVTAERQGLVSACYFWPGSEAPIRGVRPTIHTPYDGAVPNDTRVDTVLEWLRMPAERRPHMITLYFSEVDTASHGGPLDGAGVEAAARSVDRSIGRLLDGLDGLPTAKQTYLIVTSDHGMAETTPAQVVRLDSLVNPAEILAAFGGAVANLHLENPGRGRAIRDRLNAGLQHGRAYLRREVPARYHYRDNPRAGDIVVVMEEPWTLATGPPRANRRELDRWGAHGWDPALLSMHALFLAAGPGIRAGATVPEVRNVDVYPFMAELLGLRPAPRIDGEPGRIRALAVR